jgi:hypothetical protein
MLRLLEAVGRPSPSYSFTMIVNVSLLPWANSVSVQRINEAVESAGFGNERISAAED